MSSRIRKEKSCSKPHVVVISDVSDTAKRLKKELKQKEYRISIANGYDAHILSLDSGAVLKALSKDNTVFPIKQQGNS